VASRAGVPGIATAAGIIRFRLSFFTFTTTHSTRHKGWHVVIMSELWRFEGMRGEPRVTKSFCASSRQGSCCARLDASESRSEIEESHVLRSAIAVFMGAGLGGVARHYFNALAVGLFGTMIVLKNSVTLRLANHVVAPQRFRQA